jgi:hypothetical protein
MVRKYVLTTALVIGSASIAFAHDWPCYYWPVYYVEPCPTTQVLRPVSAAKPEQAPPPHATPRTSPAHTPAAPSSSPSRLPSNYSRDYAPEIPPAPGIEPSSPPRRPEVFESIEKKHYYDAYFSAGDDVTAVRRARDDNRSVCFWNLTAGRLSIRVEGKPYVLDRGKQLTLDLPRQFRWQVDGRQAESVVFEDDRAALEIVIRQ